MYSTKTTLCCLVISLFSVASICNGEGYPSAPACVRNECPEYTVVHSEKEFEIRSYSRSTVLSSPAIVSDFYKPAASKGFKILLDYIKGKNQQGKVINMTSPILVRVENSAYQVYFFLPRMYQVNYPTPLVKEIQMSYMPYKDHKYVAVKRFDGVITDETIGANVAALKKSIASTPYGSASKSTAYMVASYNSPKEFKNRVNEIFIWFD